jgi:hypothetical protein
MASVPLLTRQAVHPAVPALLRAIVVGLVLWVAAPAPVAAGIPSDYAPLVVLPTGMPERFEFDLSAALARARTDNKRLYVYLGASDCPYCREYETFLAHNAVALAPEFVKDYLVVDLRSNLSVTARRLYIRIGGSSLPYTDFQRSIGDARVRALVYPCVWLLDQQARPLMQMPTGAGTFETVAEQLDILRLK